MTIVTIVRRGRKYRVRRDAKGRFVKWLGEIREVRREPERVIKKVKEIEIRETPPEEKKEFYRRISAKYEEKEHVVYRGQAQLTLDDIDTYEAFKNTILKAFGSQFYTDGRIKALWEGKKLSERKPEAGAMKIRRRGREYSVIRDAKGRFIKWYKI